MIVGGESGPGARPMAPEWATDIRDHCRVLEGKTYDAMPVARELRDAPWPPGADAAHGLRTADGVTAGHKMYTSRPIRPRVLDWCFWFLEAISLASGVADFLTLSRFTSADAWGRRRAVGRQCSKGDYLGALFPRPNGGYKAEVGLRVNQARLREEGFGDGGGADWHRVESENVWSMTPGVGSPGKGRGMREMVLEVEVTGGTVFNQTATLNGWLVIPSEENETNTWHGTIPDKPIPLVVAVAGVPGSQYDIKHTIKKNKDDEGTDVTQSRTIPDGGVDVFTAPV